MDDGTMKWNQLVWRTIEPGDEAELQQLDAACKEADGEEPVSNLTGDALKAAAQHPDNSLCVALGERLAAAAWVLGPTSGHDLQWAQLGGRVHPELRRRGIGEALLAWSESRAQQISEPGKSLQLRITHEALTEDANRLYLDYGYENVFSEWMLVRSLSEVSVETGLPDGLSEQPWSDANAALFFRAYAAGFSDRLKGEPPAEQDWIAGYGVEDVDFRPDLSRVVLSGTEPVGFVTCEVAGKSGWIAQIAVVPYQRRAGLGHVILQDALQRLQQAGCQEAVLHVNVDNPKAQALFYKAGFTPRLMRAKFVKEIALSVSS